MPDAKLPAFVRLDGRRVTLVLATREVPSIVYWGPALPPGIDPASLMLLAAHAELPNSPASNAPIALTPLAAQGFAGRPGLAVHRRGQDFAPCPLLTDIVGAPGRATLTSVDPVRALELVHELYLEDSDVLVATTTLRNLGSALTIDRLAAPVIPLQSHLDRLIGFEGRWAGEFQTTDHVRHLGIWMRENRRGRTSHDAFPAIIAAEQATSEQHGLAYGFHLGWSGNHRLAVETLADGRGSVMFEALLLPGEVELAAGASFATPPLYASVAEDGLTGLSQSFHRHVRSRPQHGRIADRSRPVHYNSWEAVYFDHDADVLADLVDRAAAVGVERFVLDDGWFLGRRSDRAGLGDWQVDPVVYPHGLRPLIDRVEARGMRFGLWVEPEMVSPDSNLYRAHPEWAFAIHGVTPIPFRHQQVLDFGLEAVRAYVFDAIDALLREYRIDYLKWDMNRDISQPGTLGGQAGVHAHVEGLYSVLDRLRAAHPGVEIESCASGGGRADYGILERTDRIWTSDSNDALDRLGIQRGFSHFFPAEVMGSHVGPETCHITRRRLPMALRVATALFGHMGIECDLRGVAEADMATLAAGVALHKQHRGLIHSGDVVRLNSAPGVNAFMIVATDRCEALLSYTCVTEQRATIAAPLRLAGLDLAANYTVALVWPKDPLPWPLFEAATPVVTGAVLMRHGFQPPRMLPGDAVILHLTRQ